MFSIIKKFRNRPDFAFPDRAQVTMTSPFMRAYTELLVKTCHQRGAHAIGGMAAFIPSRKDPIVNENALRKVREDKLRESGDGFDGTWVAHPDLVPAAKEIFDEVLGDKVHQKERMREDVNVAASQLIDFTIPGGQITEAGLRLNLNVALQYVEAWLRGTGAVAIYNLMEDAATAEISRSQIWQWIRSPKGVLEDGRKVTLDMFRTLLGEELRKVSGMRGASQFRFDEAANALYAFFWTEFCDGYVEMVKPVFRDLDAAAMIRGAVHRVTPAAQERAVELRTETPADGLLCRSDAHRVEQILVNLLRNAIRHSPPGSSVVGRVEPDGGKVIFQIDDAGPGIGPDVAERIFDVYFTTAGEERQGHGLGLPLSRRLARLLGGDLVAESHPGGGRFVLTLPTVRADS